MKQRSLKPPQAAKILLKTFLRNGLREHRLAEYEEIFEYIIDTNGIKSAKLWYWNHTIISIPKLIYGSIYWGAAMFANFIKSSLRNIKKQKFYSFINIFGLSIGMTASFLIFLFVQYEKSYDDFNLNADNIYRVAVKAKLRSEAQDNVFTPAILTETIKREYPEVINSVRIQNFNAIVSLPSKNRILNELKIAGVDKEIFDVFTLPFIKGNHKTALANPNTAVITESIAKNYFGDSDPMDQVIGMYGDEFKITGIIKDIPDNSHFHFNVFVSIITFPWIKEQNWTMNNFKTYIQLNNNTTQAEFETKLDEIIRNYFMQGSTKEFWSASGNSIEYFLQPLKSIHLQSDLTGEIEPNGNGTYVSIFFIVGIFILLIAGINYMNLSTAKSSKRAREVGIRKVVGSNRISLIYQFLTESVIYTLLALMITVPVVHFLLPYFNDMIGKPLSISYSDNLIIILSLIIVPIIIGIGSGIYPAFLLSSLKPVSMLKRNEENKKSKLNLRNVLVVFQFSISIILLVGAFIVYKQLTFIQNKNLGFNKEQVVVINTLGQINDNYKPFKEALLQHSNIVSISTSHTLPGKFHNNVGFRTSETNRFTLDCVCCDADYAETLKLNMVQGRFFSEEFLSDSSAIILNERAVESLGLDDPLGKHIFVSSNPVVRLTIIGIVRDYHYESLHQTIKPLAILPFPSVYGWDANYISVRISSANIHSTIDYIKNSWASLVPNIPFKYTFLDQDFNNLYQNDKQAQNVFTFFFLLAMVIGCLGLFGLAAFIAEQKTKEIGIRKVLGATTQGVVVLLIRQFLKWIIIANIISWPIAYLIMSDWLQNFAYRIEITFGIFFISGIIVLLISLLTVSYHSIKAALKNPVDSLKYE